MRNLLERQTAGLSVVLGWESLTDEVLLVCQCNGRMAIVDVPPEKALDAFAHPACYLEPDQVPLLDPSHAEVEDE